MIKGRIRALGAGRAPASACCSRCRRADVVIVNPTQIAVALKYDTDVAARADRAWRWAQRKLAERITAIAREAGVPIVENRPVARALLATATVGQPIPPALYAAVAEILAFVYRAARPSPARTLPAGRREAA